MPKPLFNWSGIRCGRLVPQRKVGNNKHGAALWECKCDCGNLRTVASTDLKSGNTQSCGCKRKDTLSKMGAILTRNSHTPEAQRERSRSLRKVWAGNEKRRQKTSAAAKSLWATTLWCRKCKTQLQKMGGNDPDLRWCTKCKVSTANGLTMELILRKAGAEDALRATNRKRLLDPKVQRKMQARARASRKAEKRSGIRGLYWHKRLQLWQMKGLGSFATIKEAMQRLSERQAQPTSPFWCAT